MKIFEKIGIVVFFFTCLSVNFIAPAGTGSGLLYSSESDSSNVVINSTIPADTTIMNARHFDSRVVEQLKSDSDMHYKQPPTAAESLWQRILGWFMKIIAAIFRTATNTSWGIILTYIVGIVVIVILVMLVLRVNAFKVLYAAQGAPVDGVIHENIHEMDFDELINEAARKHDYRKGVRLLFLYALKILADKHLIRWEPGKTNHEYVGELKQPDLKEGLDDLSYYFDYAWYGNFKVNAEIFQQAQSVFSSWRQIVR